MPRSQSPRKKVGINKGDVDEGSFAAETEAAPRCTRQSKHIVVEEGQIRLRPTRSGSERSWTLNGRAGSLDQKESSIDESTESRNSKRSRSPTKRMVDLRVADKRIEEKGIYSLSDLPEDVRELHMDVQTLGMSEYGIVPMDIKVCSIMNSSYHQLIFSDRIELRRRARA